MYISVFFILLGCLRHRDLRLRLETRPPNPKEPLKDPSQLINS